MKALKEELPNARSVVQFITLNRYIPYKWVESVQSHSFSPFFISLPTVSSPDKRKWNKSYFYIKITQIQLNS